MSIGQDFLEVLPGFFEVRDASRLGLIDLDLWKD
jgi:hypothetical protein